MTRRLLLSYLTITVVVLLLFEIPLAVIYEQRETDRIATDVERDAMVLATIYEDDLENGLALDSGRAETYAQQTNARVVVVDDRGISQLDTGNETNRDFSTRAEIETALSGERSTGIRRSDTLSTDLLYVAVPVASGGTVHGAIRLTLDTHEVTERVHRFWWALVATGAVILAAMAAIGWFIARSVTRPVRRLQDVADRFASGDLAPVDVDRSAPPELTALQHGMNAMAVRLDEVIVRQRSFVSDASHQLRTPLTALRLKLENLESQIDDAATSQEIEDAISETTRLAAIVEDLLQLARTEQSTELSDIDLARVVRDRVDTWTATAEMNGVELVLTGVAACGRVQAVAGGIEQVLDNLLDNAIRVSPESSRIEIDVTESGGRCVVSIVDQGPGLNDGDKEAAFQRFWRADTSGPGSGLGMAIAHNIITASGGTIVLGDNTPTGLAVSVSLLPATTEPELRSRRARVEAGVELS